jgi:hypothetical protein
MLATGNAYAGGASGGFISEQQLDLIKGEAGGLAQPDDVEALRVSLRQAQIQEAQSESDECKSAAQNQDRRRTAGRGITASQTAQLRIRREPLETEHVCLSGDRPPVFTGSGYETSLLEVK